MITHRYQMRLHRMFENFCNYIHFTDMAPKFTKWITTLSELTEATSYNVNQNKPDYWCLKVKLKAYTERDT